MMVAISPFQTSGQLEDRPLPDVLRTFARHGETGALVIRRRGELAIVYFREGKVIGAVLPGAPSHSALGTGVAGLPEQIRWLCAWGDGEYRFHGSLTPRRPATAGEEVAVSVEDLLGDRTEDVPSVPPPSLDVLAGDSNRQGDRAWDEPASIARGERTPRSRLLAWPERRWDSQPASGDRTASEPPTSPHHSDPVVLAPGSDGAPVPGTALTDLISRFRTVLLWTTLRRPDQPLPGLLEALEQCINRLIAYHREFHLRQDGTIASSDREPAWLARAMAAIREVCPSLETVQISEAGIDASDLKATYSLIAGAARDEFYREVLTGLLRLAGRILDEALSCELLDDETVDRCRYEWSAFCNYACDRIKGAGN